MNLRRHKYKLIIAIGVLVILTLISIALLWLPRSSGERFLASRLESVLTRVLKQPVSIGQLETNLHSRLYIEDFKVLSLAKPHDSVIEIPSISLNYDLLAVLLNGIATNISIDSVAVSNLNINLVRDSTGHFNFELLNQLGNDDPSKPKSNPPDISINSLTLEDAQARYVDHVLGLGGVLRGFSSDVLLHDLSSIEFASSIESLELSRNGRTSPVGRLIFGGNWTDPELTLDRLALTSDALKFATRGSLAFGEPSPLVRASCELETSLWRLADSLEVLGVDSLPRIDATVSVQSNVSGTFAELVFDLALETESVIWDSISSGQFTAKAIGKRKSGTWSIQTEVECNQIAIPDKIIDSVDVSTLVILSDSMISFNDFEILLPDLDAQGSLEFGVGEGNKWIDGSLKVVGSITDAADVTGYFASPIISDFEGSVDLTGEFHSSFDDLYCSVDGSIPFIRFRNISTTKINLNGSYKDKIITLSRFDGELARGDFSVTGDLDMVTLRHNLNANAMDVDLYHLLSSIHSTPSPFEGFINGSIVSSGALTDPTSCLLKVHIAIDTIEFNDQAIPSLRGDLSCDNGVYEVIVTQDDTLIQGYGTILPKTLTGSFSVHMPEIRLYASLLGINELSGNLDVTGTIAGRYVQPELKASIVGNHWLYKNFPVDSLDCNLSLLNGELLIEDANVSGALNVTDSTNAPFGLSSLAGQMDYKGRMNGTLDNPEVDLTVNIGNVVYKDVAVTSGRIVVETRDREFVLKEFRLDGDSLQIAGSGSFLLDSSSGDLHLVLTEVSRDGTSSQSSSGDISVILGIKKGSSNMTIAGQNIPIGSICRIAGRQNITGNLDVSMRAQFGDEFQIDSLDVLVYDLTIAQARLDSLTMKGRMNSSELALTELRGSNADGEIKASARLERSSLRPEVAWPYGENRIEVVVISNNIDLALFTPFIPVGSSVAGYCDMDFKANGNLSDANANGYLKIHDGSYRINAETTLLDSVQADLLLTNNLLTVNTISGIYNGVPLAAKGELTFLDVDQFEITLHLIVEGNDALLIEAQVSQQSIVADLRMNDFDLALVEPMIPGIDALGGIVSAEINVSGATRNPDITGLLQFEKLNVTTSTVPMSLANCSLTVRFDQHKMDVSNFYGELGDGTIIASGRYLFDENASGSNLVVHIREARVLDTKEYLLTIKEADVSVFKSDGAMLLEGDVILGETRLRKRFSLAKLITMVRTGDQQKQARSSFLQNVRLNLKLFDSDEIWVDNNLARIKLTANMAFAGNLSKPVVSGRIGVVEGYVLYLDRKFTVDHGTLDFYDPNRINPLVDLSAQTVVKSYKSREEMPHTVTLKVTGELDQAEVVLTSVPPENISDILSLLTLGITRRDLTGADGQQGDVKFQEAMRERLELVTSRRVSGYVASNVEKSLGLESFTIENNLFNFDKNWGPQLVASKKLTDRTEITYTTTVGRMNDQGIMIAYKLTPRLVLEGQTDQVGRSGIDLKYKLKLP